VDTTVQEKAIRFPTDARLYDRARERLVRAATAIGISLRQNYNRLSRNLLCQQSRYAHARQMKRARSCVRKLKTYLGRVVRDIERKCHQPNKNLQSLLQIGNRLLAQKRNDKHKVYSVHEPAVECISKGKAHKKYEFGCKVSVAATNRGGWFVGAQALHGNPYDGHTLADTLTQVTRIAMTPEKVYVDQGYRGHGVTGDCEIHVDKRRRGRTAKSVWRWMKRRASIEPGIGHLKREHRMDRSRLKGMAGDRINAILSAAGMNFRKLLRFMEEPLRRIFCWLSFSGLNLFTSVIENLSFSESTIISRSSEKCSAMSLGSDKYSTGTSSLKFVRQKRIGLKLLHLIFEHIMIITGKMRIFYRFPTIKYIAELMILSLILPLLRSVYSATSSTLDYSIQVLRILRNILIKSQL
jgi:IS5 family transposase